MQVIIDSYGFEVIVTSEGWGIRRCAAGKGEVKRQITKRGWERKTMLFDTHTNLMWYPDHYSDEFVAFAWEAKRAKMILSEDVYFAGSEVAENNAFDSRPEQLLEATADMDKVIVFGIKAPFCGINADQEIAAVQADIRQVATANVVQDQNRPLAIKGRDSK